MIGVKLPKHKKMSLKEVKTYLDPKSVFFSCEKDELLIKNNQEVKEGETIARRKKFDLPVIASVSGKAKITTKDNIANIKDIIGADYKKTILFGKGKDLNDRNVWCDDPENKHINALMINKECINDSYIRDRIRRSIQKRVDMLKTGKISVNGNYQIAIGEPIIQLEGMFGLKPKGLLHSGEFFIEYWRKIGADKVAAFRSPMSCKQNAKVMNICNRDEVIKWYGNLKNIIVFNAWDTTMSAMNGED